MSTPDPRAWLAEVQERADAATEGPWRVWAGSRIEHEAAVETSWSHDSDGADTELIADCCPVADAEFIAHARTDLPAMVAALTAVLRLVDRAEKAANDSPARMFGGAPFPAVLDADAIRTTITEHLVAGHPDPQPETPTPGRCQRCGDQYGPWDMTWTCDHCLGGDR